MFDPTQMKHYQRYEEVRAEGSFNMWSYYAQLATGLTDEQYIFVMNNYTEMKEQAMEENRELTMTSNLANRYDIHF